MVDAALIQQCADTGLNPAIVEKFIATAGSPDPFAINVRSGDRIVLVPRPATPEEAVAIIRQHVGQAVVRVGVTQYPAGLGVTDVSELKPDLVDACANVRMGTKLFAKVYRIVTQWYGNAVDEAFDDAIHAWKTGYFEGRAVFSEPDPGGMELAEPAEEKETGHNKATSEPSTPGRAEPDDPRKAGIRVDLSGIGVGRPKSDR